MTVIGGSSASVAGATPEALAADMTLVGIRPDPTWYQYDTIRSMPNVLLRDLDPEVLEQLKAAAKANRRSLQAEIHDVLRTRDHAKPCRDPAIVRALAEALEPLGPFRQRRARS
jgi:plasmid stability protein